MYVKNKKKKKKFIKIKQLYIKEKKRKELITEIIKIEKINLKR